MAKHVTLEERDRIAQLKSRGFAQAAIAKALGRSPSVVSRKLRRNIAVDFVTYDGVDFWTFGPMNLLKVTRTEID